MNHHHQSAAGSALRTLTFTSLCALSLACSNDEVNLGDGLLEQPLSAGSRCAESPRLEGTISITDQSQLQALEGCEEIDGNLLIGLFEGADLTPLASLRTVDILFIGDDETLSNPDDPAERAAVAELSETGYLPSLRGLESLESVDLALLRSVLVEDLTELESLTRLESIVLEHTLALKSLAGLERVALLDLTIRDSPALENLDGVTFDRPMGSVVIESAPALANVDPFVDLRALSDVLVLSGTALTELPEVPLFNVRQISITDNPVLRDVSGIGAIYSGLDELAVVDNPQLTRLPDLSQITGLDFLTVRGTAVESIELNFPDNTPRSRLVGTRELELSAGMIDIGENPNLTEITSPAGFTRVQFFNIDQNDSLTEVDFGTLERADVLIIDGNAALDSVLTGSLATVDSLEVTNNPNLAPSALDGVQAFTRQISGNAPAAP